MNDAQLQDYEAAIAERENLRAEVDRLRRVYAIFEEMAPPDLPRDMFARGCFAAWEGMDAKNYRIEQLEEELANQKKATEELAELNYNLAHGGPNVHFVWRLKEEIARLRKIENAMRAFWTANMQDAWLMHHTGCPGWPVCTCGLDGHFDALKAALEAQP